MKHHIYITNEKAADNKVITNDNNPMFGIGQTNEPIRRFKELINNSSKSSNSVNMLKHYKTNKKDTDIHKLLDKIGFHNVNSVNDFIDGTSTIKNKREVFSGVAKINYKDIVNIGDKLSIELIEKIINSEDPDLFKQDLFLYPHQIDALNFINNRFGIGEKNILLNHKPRSGKSFIIYKYLIDNKFDNVLLLTQYPILNHQWKEEFENLIGHDYNVIIANTLGSDDCIIPHPTKQNFIMISLQDAKGDNNDDDEINVSDDELISMLRKSKFKNIININWDLVIFDEIHKGKETKKTDDLLDFIKFNKFIGLSATPTKNILRGTFTMENTHVHGLVDENGYREDSKYRKFYTLPRIKFNLLSIENATYYDNGIIKYLIDDLEYFTKEEQFTFQKFFATYINSDDELALKYKHDIIKYFKWVFGIGKHRDNAIDNRIGRGERIENILIFVENAKSLPLLKECLEVVLKNTDIENDDIYITNSKINNTNKLLKLIKSVESKNKRSIILANRQLTTGITLRRCDVIMLMNDWKSMDEYMQASYRCQSPGPNGRTKRFGVVFDFNPSRAFTIFYNYILSVSFFNKKTLEKNIQEFYRCTIIENMDEYGRFNEIDFDSFRNNIINNILFKCNSFENIIKKSLEYDFNLTEELKNKILNFGKFDGVIDFENVKLNDDSVNEGKTKKLIKNKPSDSNTEDVINKTIDIVKENVIYILSKTPLLSVLTNFTESDIYNILDKIDNDDELKKIYINSLLLKTKSDYNNIYSIIMELYKSLSFNDVINEYLVAFNDKYDSLLISYLKNNDIIVFINELLKLIDSYVNISESEKKLLGEVFTPFELIDNMLDTLPNEVWSNPHLKWLDPANGIGNFPIKIVSRLMNGLKDFLPDDSDRYIWIMKNMIYVCDINPKNMFVYNNLFNPENKKGLLNTYTGSFLDDDFDSFCKNNWGVEKFDIIVMNPPYQIQKDGFKKSQPLWHLFVQKTIGQLKDGGYLSAVHPSGWRNFGGAFKEIQKIMLSKEIKYLNLNDYKKGIEVFGAQTNYDYYLLKNINYNNITEINNIDDETEFVNLNHVEFIPNCNINLVYSLVANSNEDKINLLFNSSYHHQLSHMKKEKNSVFSYPCIQNVNVKNNISCLWYSNTNNRGHFGIPKVVFGRKSSGVFIDYNGDFGLAEDCAGIIDSYENLEYIAKALKNDFFIKNIMGFRTQGDKYNKKILSTFRKDFWKEFID